MKTLLSLAVFLSVSGASVADVLKLSGDRQLEGSVQEVLFLVNGKEQKFDRDSISRLEKVSGSDDELTLKDGRRVSGKLVSIKLEAFGGVMSVPRAEVVELTVKADPLGDARKELALKRAQIKPGDAKGLAQLAKWCELKGLTKEAADLAKASLAAAAGDKGVEAKETPRKGPDPGSERKASTVDDFRSAVAKCDAIEKLLEKKGLVVDGDTVRQLGSCPYCKGAGAQEGSRCRHCLGTGTSLGRELGSVKDFAAFEPVVADYCKAGQAQYDAASALLTDEKIRKLPPDVWTAAMETVGPRIRIVPDEKGLVLAVPEVRTVIPQDDTTILILTLQRGTYGSVSPEARITVGRKLEPPRVGSSFYIRGTVTGKKDGFLVIEDYQTYPEDLGSPGK